MRPAHLETRYRWDLSPRQREVLELIAKGRTNGEIAADLGISLDGAKYHVREILGKLGVESREEAVSVWRSGQRSTRWRWLDAIALGGLGKAAVIAAAAIGIGAAAAAALVLTTGDDGGGEPVAPVGSETAARSPSATGTQDVTITGTPTGAPVTPTPAATPTAPPVAAPCQSTDFEAALTFAPAGDDVRLSLSLQGAKACTLAGELLLDTLFPPTDPGPDMPKLLLARSYPIGVEFPFSGQVGEWLWTNWCGDPVDVPWVVRVEPPFGQVSLSQPGPTAHPACSDPGSPTLLRDVSIGTALGGELFDPHCAPGIAEWTCQFAAMLRDHVAAGRDLFEIVRRGHSQYIARCGEPWPPDSGEAKLCEGSRPGEIREGFPLALHGSEGSVLTALAMAARLEDVFAAAPRVTAASTGTAVDDPGTSRFIIAFATDSQPAAAYLVFEHFEGHEPSFIGAGLSGDNADVILAGGVTMTGLGATEFVPLGIGE